MNITRRRSYRELLIKCLGVVTSESIDDVLKSVDKDINNQEKIIRVREWIKRRSILGARVRFAGPRKFTNFTLPNMFTLVV